MKMLSRRQVTTLVLIASATLVAGVLLLSYLWPSPRDILNGTWKQVSALEDRSMAFFPDGKVFLYVDGKRSYQGKFKFVDPKTLKIEYYLITSRYYSIKVLSRTSIELTDEKNSTVKYTKIPR